MLARVEAAARAARPLEVHTEFERSSRRHPTAVTAIAT
jgi:hypothetical protein